MISGRMIVLGQQNGKRCVVIKRMLFLRKNYKGKFFDPNIILSVSCGQKKN